MIHDTHRGFILKLIAGSAAISIVWLTVVGPKLKNFEDFQQTHKAQTQEIIEGEETIEQYSKQVAGALENIQGLRNDLGKQLDVNQEFDIHKNLQDSAESYNLTVSRIEPLRDTISKRTSTVDGKDIKILTREFRIECAGAYDSIVRYIQDLTQSTNLTKVSAFRVVPVTGEEARMVLQVQVYTMPEAPVVLKESDPTQITDAGATNE